MAASYAEALDGDLSDDRLVPTSFLAGSGTHLLSGTFGNGDLDYINIGIAQGFALDSLTVLPETTTGSQFSFIAVQQGPAMTVSPATAPTGLLGWSHFSSADVGGDLLVAMGTAIGALGFAGPLPAGEYTFWIQELEYGEGLGYSLQLDIVPVVPVPAAAWLFGSALAVLAVQRRRVLRPSGGNVVRELRDC